MIIKYDEVKQILYGNEFAKLVPDGLIISQPIMGKKQGKNVDNFFVMSKVKNVYHPIYKFSICSEEKTLVEFSEYESVKVCECPVQEGLTIDEFERYKKLYEQVRKSFFYNESINADDVIEYMVCLFKLIPISLKNFYNDLSPEFFTWVKTIIN